MEKKSQENQQFEENLDGLRFVQFHFSDPTGGLHYMEESIDNVPGILKSGVGVDGSSVIGFGQVEKSDIILFPERSSFSRFVVEGEEIGMYWCHVLTPELEKHPNDPRNVLQLVIDKAAKMGFECEMFSELEFYVLDEKTRKPVDNARYLSPPPLDKCSRLRYDFGHAYEKAGLKVKRIHHELGPGQNEVELQLTPVMKNCDDSMIAIWLAQLISSKYNWVVDFTPKPFPEIPGNGLHQHIRLKDIKTKENVMAAKEGGLSKIALQFIAGMLKYSRDITAVFGNDPNTYDRLKPGYEAPIYATWDYSNRSALVRIPAIGKGDLSKTRVEFRGGDASGSIHLLCAMILAAGLKGIEENLECPKNTIGDVAHLTEQELKDLKIEILPTSLPESLKILEESKFIAEFIDPSLKTFMNQNGLQKMKK
ncbi:glutamine synthetase [Anaeramoeba ignava]|uniref:Glutamine synthetase n=1 Tax=Anaeramoeba ignava TaxID=1746090 RepID=A0A9Q0LJS4_ANAIG|nr:glutamine synthetase [Anaeramoeba ignava]|eukprot:Anaeramoba_ignava/a478438_451.p1 GENE.a478438_451~~a478438_451.p1  ORF type:complete len:423 (-),score=171.51 a478438_451:196-1464(-)